MLAIINHDSERLLVWHISLARLGSMLAKIMLGVVLVGTVGVRIKIKLRRKLLIFHLLVVLVYISVLVILLKQIILFQ